MSQHLADRADRRLMNTNSDPEAPRIISTRTWEKRPPAPADGNSPLRQVLAAPGVTPDHWPVPRQRSRMSWRGSWLAKYGTAARSPVHRRENFKVVSFAANLRRSWQSGPPESAHCPAGLSSGWPESHSRLSSPFSGIPAVSVFPQAPAGSRTVRPAAVIRPAPGPGAQARAAPRHDRLGPNPRPPAQIRSNVPRGATRSSTARYFILYRIKVT